MDLNKTAIEMKDKILSKLNIEEGDNIEFEIYESDLQYLNLIIILWIKKNRKLYGKILKIEKAGFEKDIQKWIKYFINAGNATILRLNYNATSKF